MIKISAVMICYNNQETIKQCITSLSFADEIIVLDSYSTDNTLEILKLLKCTVQQQKFKGYWQQKQDVINLASHDWVVLLDSDEFLTQQAQDAIKTWQQSKADADAYKLPRREWVFWQWSSNWTHMNTFIRLFDKTKASMSQDLVHESIKTTGKVATLNAVIKHYSETSINIKLTKINHYSALAAQQKFAQGKRVHPLKLGLYPIWYFFKQYFIRRQIFNGTAGFINAKLNSKYAFLKYAKLYELNKTSKQ
ncbi:MAG: glycosyltransferase family 2 protein [Proteobacteria bacterium]|nr:glycosyltransferase family 2 protein [Pseudomonadota bacterium]